MLHAAVVSGPFLNDDDIHVAKQSKQHHELRNKFEEELNPSLPVDCIETLLDYGQSHVCDSVDHGHLHLHRIVKRDLLVRLPPDGVQAGWVDTFFVARSLVSSLEVVTRLPEVDRNRYEVIVHEAAEECEKAHEQEDVTQEERALHGPTAQPGFCQNEEGSKDEQKSTVTHVSEHHSEQEGEGNAREDRWVDLLVGWYTIRVSDQLEHRGELVGFEASWR